MANCQVKSILPQTLCKRRRRFIRTTDSRHPYPVYPNLCGNKPVTVVNRVWVADITYIHILADFVFLAVILDACSRKVVGWALSRRINAELTTAALKAAITQRRPSPGCIHHSDRGVQYASGQYVQILKEHGFLISMSRKGNPYDNAHAESFIKTLKAEEVHLSEYRSVAEIEKRISIFIDQVYNRERLHSALGYLSPVEFENNIRSPRHVLTSTSNCPT